MTPYFAHPDHAAALVAACRAWEGTPFREGIAKRGVGIDCAPGLREVFREAGVDVSPVDNLPRTSLNAGRFQRDSYLLDVLRSLGPRFPLVDEAEPFLCGDVVGVQVHLSCNHLALVEDADWAWHVPYGGVWSRVPLGALRKMIKARHRLMSDV